MPKPRRKKAKIQDEEEGSHLQIAEGASTRRKHAGTRGKSEDGIFIQEAFDRLQ